MTDTPPRLGLLVPSTNSVAEIDFQGHAPEGVSVHTARMFIDATTAEAERRMIHEYLPVAARDLGTVRPDAVVFSCTSAAAVVGPDGEAQLLEDVARLTGARVVSTNAAVHEALTALAPAKLAILTPYIAELTAKIREGIERIGIPVICAFGMEIVDPFAIAEVDPDAILRFAEEKLVGRDFDALFVSCTNLPAFAARERLAERFGVPVVTSNQAAFEAALRALAVSEVQATEGARS
jgi:maleate isomerase